jgi:MoxR-like ATPase
VDRFMLKVVITYPDRREEREIMERMTRDSLPPVHPVISPEAIVRARGVVSQIYVDEKIKDYVLDIVFATREPEEFNLADLKPLIAYGASPRATIYLIMTAKAHAFLHGRSYVTPEDIKQVAMDVLRHRIIVTYEAEAEELTSEDVVRKILDQVEVP